MKNDMYFVGIIIVGEQIVEIILKIKFIYN